MQLDTPSSTLKTELIPLELQDILRVSHEPLRQFSDFEVHQLLCADLYAYLNYLDQGLREIVLGAAQISMPPKQLFQQPGELGDFRVMPCVRATAAGKLHKTIKLVGTNRIGRLVPDQISVGKACYLDPQENFVSHQFDACLLSSIRTGACAALATRHLQTADRPIRTVTVVGAGRVGFYAAMCLLNNGEIDTLTIVDHLPERAVTLAAGLQRIAPDCQITTTEYADLSNCDLLLLATSSNTAIYHPDHFSAQIIITLGADCIEQRELHDHPQWHSRAIYVDTLDSLRFGDLAAWTAESEFDSRRLIEITHLAANHTRPPDYPALFIATGSALFDNLTMSYLVEITTETGPVAPPAETALGTD